MDCTRAYHLACFRALLDIHHELLLALFELCPFAIEFALCFGERPLMLSQPFSGGHCSAKERFLDVLSGL